MSINVSLHLKSAYKFKLTIYQYKLERELGNKFSVNCPIKFSLFLTSQDQPCPFHVQFRGAHPTGDGRQIEFNVAITLVRCGRFQLALPR